MNSHLLPGNFYTKIGEDMTWPSCTDEVAHLEWKVRHHPESVSRGDMLVLASIVSAYIDLTRYKAQKKRNAICSALKAAVVCRMDGGEAGL